MKNISENDRPPVFKRWRTWYILLLGTLAFLISLFYLFMKTFN